MSKRIDYEKKTESFVIPLLKERGFSLYDVEYVREQGENYLRIFIDKPGGITIDDCVDISRKMNEILDSEDYISDAYTFEVSSPGVERRLRKEQHFLESIGKDITIKLYAPIDGRKEFQGRLEEYEGDSISISCDDGEHCIALKDIAIARLSWQEQ